MESTMAMHDLLRDGERVAPARTLRKQGEGDVGRRPIEELYCGLVEAAVTRDLDALRAIAAQIARTHPDARLDYSGQWIAFSTVE